MSDTQVQYQLPGKGQDFNKVTVSCPVPGLKEICIRVKSVALNPLEWKQRSYGIVVEQWPAVIGSDYAGIVESVGAEVTSFKTGDAVFGLRGPGNRGGTFQEVVIVPAMLACKKPSSLSFDEAASLSVGYLTAAAGVVVGLGIPLPYVSPTESKTLRSVLVIGGSSSVGASAIQLLRLVLPSAVILTTSSSIHHARLQSLGATACFDRSAQDQPDPIRQATPGGSGVDAIFDTVGAGATQPAIFDALNADGPKIYSRVETGANVVAPETLNSNVVNLREIFSMEGGPKSLQGLYELLESGKFRLPIDIEVLGRGFDVIQSGLDQLSKGVSGKKLVVSIS